MFASLSARLALIAALVLSQAIVAGHDLQHDSSNQPECQTCLQTSAGSVALLCSGIHPPATVYDQVLHDSHAVPVTTVFFTLPPPSRAPPLFPL